MKLKTLAPAMLFALVSSLSVASHAADADKAVAPDSAKSAEKKAKPDAQTPAPQGSAMHDKKAAKLKADKDHAKHYHPRDGK